MIDMHFHTNNSDGHKSNNEIIKIAKDKNLKYITATDHDFINKDFYDLALENGFKTKYSTEISVNDDIFNKQLHLTMYSEKYENELDEIFEKTRFGRENKIKLQIEKLSKNGFDIDIENYYEYYKIKNTNLGNLNITHLTNYIFNNLKNIELLQKITGKNISKDDFMKHFLKKGDYKEYGYVKAENTKPTIKIISEIARKTNSILSIAHPNFKFELDEFENNLKTYLDLGINAIEINSKATKNWIEKILELKEKYDFILTFGSDCHFEEIEDKRHGNLGEINPYLTDKIISENIFKIFN